MIAGFFCFSLLLFKDDWEPEAEAEDWVALDCSALRSSHEPGDLIAQQMIIFIYTVTRVTFLPLAARFFPFAVVHQRIWWGETSLSPPPHTHTDKSECFWFIFTPSRLIHFSLCSLLLGNVTLFTLFCFCLLNSNSEGTCHESKWIHLKCGLVDLRSGAVVIDSLHFIISYSNEFEYSLVDLW